MTGSDEMYMKTGKVSYAAALILAAVFSFTACSASGADQDIKETGTVPEEYVRRITENVPADAAVLPDKDEAGPVNLSSRQEEAGSENKNPLTDKHVRIRLTDSGKDIFTLWGYKSPDYRYGPSMITDGGDKIDAWFAFPGDSRKEYDWISYRHSDDGGDTWNDEKIVLAPTPGSMDRKSVCDPDLIYHDGYYYMAYTGTINSKGLCNNVFLARSENPDGPYEKWNGSCWGGDPIPVIYYNGVDIGWGCGEPSLVIAHDRLFIYNTLDSFSSTGWVRATRVHTADLTDPMWPSRLQFEGICVFRDDHTDEEGYTYKDSDSWDVAYLEDSQKYIALTTNRRFTGDSCLLYYESYDGINFSRISELNTDVCSGCHNCGLSADESGHIDKDDRVYIGYAYSGGRRDTWGAWATRLAQAKISYTDAPDRTEDTCENLQQELLIDSSRMSSEPVMLLTDQTVYNTYEGSPIDIRYYTMNGFRKKDRIGAEDIIFEDYDHELLGVSENNLLVPLREGISNVRLNYRGLRREICVRILPPQYDEMRIKRFYPVCRRYDVKVNEPVILKVRPVAEFGDHDLEELSGYDLNFYNITFRSSDISVCCVADDGTLSPIVPGTAVITVQGDDCRYTLDVHVTE